MTNTNKIMISTYIDCPKCDSEIEFCFEREKADDGNYYVLSKIKRLCDCLISERGMDVLEAEAMEDIDEG